MNHIFGFCEDFKKIVYGFKHVLTLYRKDDNDSILRDEACAVGKIVLDKLAWYVPHVEPALEQKMKLYKVIENKSTLNV